MRILADRNIPCQLVEALRFRGHEVVWVHEDMPGVADEVVLVFAQKEKRLLLAFDKDFGELAMRYGLPAECGVILLRLTAASAEDITEQVIEVLESRDDWQGHFSVVKQHHIRMIPYPRPKT